MDTRSGHLLIAIFAIFLAAYLCSVIGFTPKYNSSSPQYPAQQNPAMGSIL